MRFNLRRSARLLAEWGVWRYAMGNEALAAPRIDDVDVRVQGSAGGSARCEPRSGGGGARSGRWCGRGRGCGRCGRDRWHQSCDPSGITRGVHPGRGLVLRRRRPPGHRGSRGPGSSRWSGARGHHRAADCGPGRRAARASGPCGCRRCPGPSGPGRNCGHHTAPGDRPAAVTPRISTSQTAFRQYLARLAAAPGRRTRRRHGLHGRRTHPQFQHHRAH